MVYLRMSSSIATFSFEGSVTFLEVRRSVVALAVWVELRPWAELIMVTGRFAWGPLGLFLL